MDTNDKSSTGQTFEAGTKVHLTIVVTAFWYQPQGRRPGGMSRHIEIPDEWWIAEGATGEPTVWAPPDGNPLGYPTPVVEERAVNYRLWGLLAAVLPDRGDCEWCTATPCDAHA